MQVTRKDLADAMASRSRGQENEVRYRLRWRTQGWRLRGSVLCFTIFCAAIVREGGEPRARALLALGRTPPDF